MTDITELAQRLKLEVHRAVSNFNPQMNIKTRDLKELVEELEKARRHANLTEAERQAYLGLISKRDERIVELEEAEQKLCAANVTLDARAELAECRLAELESRTVTVKLPDIMPPEAAPAHYWGSGESMAYADGYNKSAADLKTSFALSCSSADVNVEFE